MCSEAHILHTLVVTKQDDLITRKPAHPSVVIVIILGYEDVVLLQQRSKVLADLSPHIQEGHDYQSNPEKAEGGLHGFGQNGAG